ncbi:PREDICTED: protein PF14_0175-like isoform X2 [Papilio xuthus]|uniref:Protein PF14_0175-like isoform X2 n=1 Tax=Papilio xuthus TaxID=66420 RepID=A0AAJ6ZM23_PAPXU|nr:PREDICTED: protein PF14_0175-like isoform X2 [Papilio xuthus]
MDLFLFLITIFYLPLITRTQPFIDCSDIGSNHSNMAHNTSRPKNNTKNIIKNNKNVDLKTNITVNKLVDDELSSKIIERSPFNALQSNSTLSAAVNSISLNISHNNETIKDKAKEMLQQNSNKTHSKNNMLKTNEGTIAIQRTTVSSTEWVDVTLDLNIPTESYITHSNDIPSISSVQQIETISTTPEKRVTSNLNIPTEGYDEIDTSSKDVILSNSSQLFVDKISTTPKTVSEKYAQNATISNNIPLNASAHEFKAISTTANESVTSNSSKTAQNGKFTKYITPSNSSGQQIETTSAAPKTIISKLSTPSIMSAQNTTFSTDVLFNFSTNLNKTISTTTTPVKIVTSNLNTRTEIYAPNDMFSRGIVLPDSLDFNSAGNSLKTATLSNDKLNNENTIFFEDLVHPTPKLKNVTAHVSTTTPTYIQNGIMPNPIIPSESSEFDITFGDILKVDKESTDIKSSKQVIFTEKAVSDSTINPDSILSDKNFHTLNKNTNVSLDTITDKLNTNVSTDLNTEITTDKTMLVMKTLNSTLNTNVETITEFTTENIITLQQTDSYQTTLRSNDLGDIKNTLFEDTDYSVLLFPASTVETLVTELSTTPQAYIQNDISNPIIPNESPDFDISFGDLIKGNKDFIELKSPLHISFTDRPISDLSELSENRESLRNFRSTSHNNSLNYDIISNSSEKNIKPNDIFDTIETKNHNISVTNVVDPQDNFVNNETVIVANDNSNKDFLLNRTNTKVNSTVFIPNTKNNLDPAKIHKEIIKKIPDADKIISPINNLTNHGLNITTEDIEVKEYTNSNKTMKNAKYLSADEKRLQDKVPEVEILSTTTTSIRTSDDIRNHTETIKRIESELLNSTINKLINSTQSPSETSYYFTNTENTTLNSAISENKTIESIKNNTIDLLKRILLENNMTEELTPSNNGEIFKNNSVESIEDITKPILNLPNKSVDLLNNVINTEAKVSNPDNSKDQTKDIPEKTYITEEPILNSFTLLDNITENTPAILFNANTKNGLDTFIFYKEIDEKNKKAEEKSSPEINLSNNMLNVTAVPTAEKGLTKSNQTKDNATYAVSEKGVINKLPISTVLTENITVRYNNNLNDKNIESVPSTDIATSIMNDVRKNNMIIKRPDSELLNKTLNVLNSTKYSLQTSNYLTNTEGITSYDQNETIDALPNNTGDLLQSETRNNGEIVNNKNVLSSAKTTTESVLNTSHFTSVDPVKNIIHTDSISNSNMDNDQTEKIFTNGYLTEAPILNSSAILDKVAENQAVTEKNIVHENNSNLHNTENTTERTLHTPTSIGNKSILNDTFVDMIKNNQKAPISIPINNERQATDFTESPTVLTNNNKVPMMIKNRQNRPEQLLIEDNRKENVNEFASNNSKIVTKPTLKKPVLTTNSYIVDKANDDLESKVASNTKQLHATKHNLPNNSKSTLNIPHKTMTTENVHLTTESENLQITSTSLINNDTSALKTSQNQAYNEKISNKRKYQNTIYDAFVNSLHEDLNSTLQSSNSTNKNEKHTTLNLENIKEKVTAGDSQQVNNNFTTISSRKFLNATKLLIPKNSTLTVLNKTNYSMINANVNTSKAIVDHGLNKILQTNKSVMNIATANINNSIVNKYEQENLNSKSNFNKGYDTPINPGNLHLKLNKVTTKSIDNIEKVPEQMRDDKVTEQSQHNIKNLTLLKESKNGSIIQKCSNRSICISQANGQVSIELYNKTRINVSIRNKTDSNTKEMRKDDNDHALNTTIINILPRTKNKIETQTKTTPFIPTYLNRTIVEFKNVNTTDVVNTKSFKDGLPLKTSDLVKTNVMHRNKDSTEPSKRSQGIHHLTSNNHELKRQIQNNTHINITIVPVVKEKSKEYKIVKINEMPIKNIQTTTKSSLILQNSEQSRTATSKTYKETPKSSLTFDCRNHSRGRYADKDNCRKFYICIGYSTPIVGFCPENTVFSEFKKQCTNNLSHCIRNNQFKCVKDGRFIDVWQDNMYYLCVKGPNHRFLRLKLQCKSGYILDKVNVTCKQGKKDMKLSSSSSNSSSSSSSSDRKKNKSNKKSNKKLSNDTGFKCNEEGKFVDPNNCRKYYVCSKTSKSVLRRKRKKCDSDEVFDDDKKKCVDEDSYECK